jgi:hypothetical protein
MAIVPTPFRPVSLSPADEALELRDFGAADVTPGQDPDGFPPDDTDDPEFVAAMQRIEAARLAGYVEAACLGCGAALFVPESGRCGDVLCPGCQRKGNALAAEEDGHEPTPPAGGGAPLPTSVLYWAPMAGRFSDDQLLAAVGIAQEDPSQLGLHSSAEVAALLAAFSAEVVTRLGRAAA